MFRKIFRKTFLLSGILLLSVFVVVQSSWGCDDTDKWDCDRHDKWGCDDHDIQCHPPKIQIVYLGFDDKFIYFTILGKNFDNGAQPVVTLGGTYNLTVVGSVTENQILATYPITGFEYGDYRLVVSTCHDSTCKDKYCKDHGPKCTCKYCRDHCSRCKDKYCKDKYCKDHEYECKCKDRYSLTIAGPAGLPGPKGDKGDTGDKGDPGISNYERTTETYSSIPSGTSVMYAACTSGKRLLGGGGGFSSTAGVFSAYQPIRIVMIYNGPAPGKEEWNILWYNQNESEIKVNVEVYAICADVLDQSQ